jgi:dipeptidyl aminopeptidase/acylaminoacyl peptidase
LITAFYGGENRYSAFDQIMCAAGLTVISPAVRGSDGFGKAFFALNDEDLGGDEIVDLFWVARWAEQQLGLPAARIGVYGGSHGGYATMRALTFPPRTNGRNELYPFGFGMAHAGFSDIESFYRATNIPDWVVLESGDPNVPRELERMRDRSPLTHAERLRAPLLLTHGSQDWRVPVEESRRFAAKAKAAGLPVQYVEFEGQGHHIEGLALQGQAYQVRLSFLQAVAEAATAAAAQPAPAGVSSPTPSAGEAGG